MALGKRLINTGAEAACTTDSADVFGDSNGVALYNLDYDASEASGTYDGTPTNVEFGVGGQINYGARFNGSSSYIAVGSPIPNTDTNAAISAWVKLSSGISSNMHITGTGITTAASEAPFRATLQYQSANTFKIFALRQVAGVYYLASTSSLTNVTINADTWYHIVWSYNSTGRKLSTFLNGTAIDTDVAMTTSGSSVNDSSTVIGSFRSTSGPFFDGDLDQIRFFTSTLTQANAATLHAETACVYTATTTDNDYPTTNLAYYKLDNSAEDEKGSYDGTETNVEYRFGRFGQAAVFNGSSSIITATQPSGLNGPCTYSAWLKTTSNSYQSIITVGSVTGSHTAGVNLFVNSGKLSCQTGNGSSTENSTVNSTSDIDTGNWVHCAVVVAGSTQGSSIKVYVNGQEEGSGTADNTAIVAASSESLCLGGRILSGSQSTFLNGSLDQVRIFSTALTSDQVTELYNEKPETDTSTFKTVLYEGTGSTQYISNVGFNLDVDNGGDGGLVWIKARDTSNSHALFDTVRGATNQLSSDLAAQEASYSTVLSSFDANGFFVETSSIVNTNNDDYVAWCWKAGGDAVTGTGTGVTNVSISANTEAGFSIVKFTGVSGSGQTVEHGLDYEPEIYFLKGLDNSTDSWIVCGNSTIFSSPTTNFLRLNTNDSVGSTTAGSVGSNGDDINVAVRTYAGLDTIAYCWHSVSGVSKIGTYEGNAGTQTIYTTDDGTSSGSGGFEPSFVMMKNVEDTTNSHWLILDSARSTTNPRENELYANLSLAEQDLNRQVNFVSNGFELTSSSYTNRSGIDYIFMAFK